jgi:DNA-binding FadR family transcriptional regulator
MADSAPGSPEEPAVTAPERGGRRGLHAEVVDRLGSMIAGGAVEADEPVVPEEVGRRYGVSRTVVREALRVLEAKGMVSARPNVGTRVRPISDWNLLDPDVIGWRVRGSAQRDQLRELLELRGAVEPYAARLAAGRPRPGTHAALWEAYRTMEETVRAGDVAGFTSADIGFHHALLRASGNHMIEQLHVTVAAALRVRGEQLMSADDIGDETVRLHRRVAAAVSAGSPDQAERRMRELLDAAHHATERVLERWHRHT